MPVLHDILTKDTLLRILTRGRIEWLYRVVDIDDDLMPVQVHSVRGTRVLAGSGMLALAGLIHLVPKEASPRRFVTHREPVTCCNSPE